MIIRRKAFNKMKLIVLFLTILSTYAQSCSQISQQLSSARYASSSASIDNFVIIAGGLNSANSVVATTDIMDFTTNQRSASTMGTARAYFASTTLGSLLLFGGGQSTNPTFLSTCEIYNYTTRTWNTMSFPSQLGRSYLAATTVGSKAIFSGGRISSTMCTTVVDMYDLDLGQWSSSHGNLSVARDRLTAASVGSFAFFAGGAISPSATSGSNIVDIYSLLNNSWTVATLSSGRYLLAATSVGSKVLFGGGYTGSSYSRVVDIYDVITNTWSASSALPVGAKSLAAATSGRKAFFGGGDDGNTGIREVAVYDVSTGLWSSSQSLQKDKTMLTSVAIRSAVLFIGGRDIPSNQPVENTIDSCSGCSNCASGSEPTASCTCQACTVANCDRCYNGKCLLCKPTFFLNSAGQCQSCFQNCYWCTNNQTCTQCRAGFTRSLPDGKFCLDWSSLTPNISIARSQLTSTSIKDIVFFAGGQTSTAISSASNVVDIINMTSHVITSTTLSTPRTLLSSIALSPIVMFIGGVLPSDTYSGVIDIYDVNTQLWSTQNLCENRLFFTTTTLGNKIFISGGQLDITNNSLASDKIDIYDLETNQITIHKLNISRYHMGSCTIGNYLFLAGGQANSTSFYSTIDIYDITTNHWNRNIHSSYASNLSSARAEVSCASIAYQVMFFGGKFVNDGLSRTVDIYNILTQTWSNTLLSTPRSSLSVQSLGLRLYLTSKLSSSMEIYDYKTDSWSQSSLLSNLRVDYSSISVWKYILYSGGRAISDSSMLKTVDVLTDCPNCESGYEPTTDCTCRACNDVNCDKCVNGVCIFCKATYYLNTTTNTCSSCSSNCLWCINSTKCTQCKSQYVLSRYQGTCLTPPDLLSPGLYPARYSLAGTAVSQDKLAFFAGGYTMTPITTTSSTPEVVSDASSVVNIYNMDTKTYINTSLSISRGHLVGVSLYPLVFFAGGYDTITNDTTNIVDIYNVTSQQWQVASLSQKRARLASVVLGTKAIFAGGATSVGPVDLEGFTYLNPVAIVDFYDINSNTWSNIANGLSIPRQGLCGCSIGIFAFFAGGMNADDNTVTNVDIYNIQTQRWSLEHLSEPRQDMGCGTLGSKIFFAGGEVELTGPNSAYYDSNLVDIYDAITNTWSVYFLSVNRTTISVSTVGLRIFFAGGYQGTTTLSVVDVFELSTERWYVQDLAVARWSSVAVAVGSYALFAGGCQESDLTKYALSQIDLVYDCDPCTSGGFEPTLQCTCKACPDSACQQCSNGVCFACKAGFFLDGTNTCKSCASGCLWCEDQQTCNQCDARYTLSPDKRYCHDWSLWTPSLSIARSQLTANTLSTLAFFTGGKNDNNQPLSTIDIFDMTSTSMTSIPNVTLSTPRFNVISATSFPIIMFIGGQLDNTPASLVNIIDVYNMTNNSWSTTSLPTYGRVFATATSVGNKIIIGGGLDSSSIASNIVDIFDIDRLEWVNFTLSIARYRLASASLGRFALFAGGQSSSSAYLDRVDLYDLLRDMWSTSTLSLARTELSSGVIDKYIIFAGGRSGVSTVSDRIDMFNVIDQQWSQYALSIGRVGVLIGVNGQKLLLSGGQLDNTLPTNVVDMYDMEQSYWSVTQLSSPRVSASVVSIDKYVLFAGGSNETAVVDTIDVFTGCGSCGSGFEASSACTCAACSENCERCSNHLCYFCKKGFYADQQNNCAACAYGCNWCTNSSVCGSCLPGYKLVNGKCLGCPADCETCRFDQCLTCPYGNLLNNGRCYDCKVGNQSSALPVLSSVQLNTPEMVERSTLARLGGLFASLHYDYLLCNNLTVIIEDTNVKVTRLPTSSANVASAGLSLKEIFVPLSEIIANTTLTLRYDARVEFLSNNNIDIIPLASSPSVWKAQPELLPQNTLQVDNGIITPLVQSGIWRYDGRLVLGDRTIAEYEYSGDIILPTGSSSWEVRVLFDGDVDMSRNFSLSVSSQNGGLVKLSSSSFPAPSISRLSFKIVLLYNQTEGSSTVLSYSLTGSSASATVLQQLNLNPGLTLRHPSPSLLTALALSLQTINANNTQFTNLLFTQRTNYISSTSSLFVTSSPVVATVIGGQQRTVSSRKALILNASQSYDPDLIGLNTNSAASYFTYQWTCSQNSLDITSIINTLSISGLNQPILSIPANVLQAGQYIFTLSFSSNYIQLRSSMVFVVVDVIVEDVYLSIQFLDDAPVIRGDIPLRFVGALVAPNPQDYMLFWNEQSGLLNSPNAILSLTDKSLTLAPNVLQPNQQYTIEFVATSINNPPLSASFTLPPVNQKPVGGSCSAWVWSQDGSTSLSVTTLTVLSVTPLTMVNARCANWTDLDGSSSLLQYYFEVRNVGNPSQKRIVSPNVYLPSSNFILPMGQWELFGMVRDNLGGQAEFRIGQLAVSSDFINTNNTSSGNNSIDINLLLSLLQSPTTSTGSILTLLDSLLQITANDSTILTPRIVAIILNILDNLSQNTVMIFDVQIATLLDTLTTQLHEPTHPANLLLSDGNTTSTISNICNSVSTRSGNDPAVYPSVLHVVSQIFDTAPCTQVEGLVKLVRYLGFRAANLPGLPAINFNNQSNSLSASGNPLFLNQSVNIVANGLQINLTAEMLSSSDSYLLNALIARFGSLKRCRIGGTAKGFGGEIVLIELSTWGSGVKDVNFLSQPFSFLLPISDSLLDLDPCTGWKETSQVLPTCAWWNSNVQQWSTFGCDTGKTLRTDNGSFVECTCNHLTEFALLMYKTEHPCAKLSSAAFQITMTLYTVMGSVSLAGVLCIVYVLLISPRPNFGDAVLHQYTLITVVCLCRALESAKFAGLAHFSAGVDGLILCLPYMLVFWIFFVLIFQWANIHHLTIGELNSGRKKMRPIFIGSGCLLSLTMMVLFISYTLNGFKQKTLALCASFIVSAVYIVTGAAFLFYGYNVAAQIRRSSVGGTAQAMLSLAQRMGISSLLVCCALIFASILWMVSILQINQAENLTIAFFFVELIALITMFALFVPTVRMRLREALKRKVSLAAIELNETSSERERSTRSIRSDRNLLA